MNKIQNNILIVLGIIGVQFLIYFFIFKPINSGTPLSDTINSEKVNDSFPTMNGAPKIPATSTIPKPSVPTTTTFPGVEDSIQPFLTEEQEKMLETFGIDASTLTSEMTPEMQECFIEKLGEQRVMEIIGGATPNAIDLFKAGSCLNI
jgi:hypothetical protein